MDKYLIHRNLAPYLIINSINTYIIICKVFDRTIFETYGWPAYWNFPLGEIPTHYLCHFMDGWPFLFSEAFGLSLRKIRNWRFQRWFVERDGIKTTQSDHEPRDDSDLGFRYLIGVNSGNRWLGLGLAVHKRIGDFSTHMVSPLASAEEKRFFKRQQHSFGPHLSVDEWGTNCLPDIDRFFRGFEILTFVDSFGFCHYFNAKPPSGGMFSI